MWGEMRMDPTDLGDVSRYTFLMNGKKELKLPAKKTRLRFVNAAAMTFFDVSIPNLKMKLVAADGQDVKPVTINEFRIAPAETYDVIIEPKSDKSYAIIAESLDRTGRVIANSCYNFACCDAEKSLRCKFSWFRSSNVPQLKVASGLAEFEVGTLTRYEINRRFAPYFALRYNRKTFGTEEIAKKEHDRVSDFIASIGLRLRF